MKHTPEEIKNRLSNIGEAIGNIALDYITELEKENLYYKDIVETNSAEWEEQGQRAVALEKENAELKREWQEQVQKATDEGYARTLQTVQLTKAKEIIRDFISVAIDYIDKEDKNYSIIVEAEQFLSEVEK